MKRKLSFGVVALLTFSASVSTHALTEETGSSRYDTELCRTTDGAGNSVWGSRCSPPSKNGPCTTTSTCRFSAD